MAIRGDIVDRSQQNIEAFTLASIHAACYVPGRGPLYIDGVPLCRECGEAIHPRRIKALPGIETCFECAEKREV